MIAVSAVEVFKLGNLYMHEWLMHGQLHAVWAFRVNTSGIRFLNAPLIMHKW